jgi:hypothetical protein
MIDLAQLGLSCAFIGGLLWIASVSGRVRGTHSVHGVYLCYVWLGMPWGSGLLFASLL